MAKISERQIFDALGTLSRAVGEGTTPFEGSLSDATDTLSDAAREVMGEAAFAVAFGAFAARGGSDGPMHALVTALGLMAMLAGEEPDPPAEILRAAAEDARVEAEIDRAGEAVDAEFDCHAPGGAIAAALEARILGTAILLAGCTEEKVEDQTAVRLGAARTLTRLAAGLLLMNEADETAS